MLNQEPTTAIDEPQRGVEWLIEAHGCDPTALADVTKLRSLFDQLTRAMSLHPVSPSSWHQFPNTGGITGMSLLQESHLACHTFPEYGSLCLNLFCCRERAEANFEALIKESLAAAIVRVRKIERPYSQLP